MKRLIFALLFLYLGAIAPAMADAPGWCGNNNYSKSHPLAWERFTGEVEVLVREGQIQEAYALIVNALDTEMSVLPSNPQANVVKEALQQYLAYIVSPQGLETPAVFDSGSANPEVIPPILQYQLGPFGSGNEAPTLFAVTIPCPELVAGKNPALRNVAHALWALHKVSIQQDFKNGLQIASLRSSQLYRDYENYALNGLPMWPWEMWLNGYLVPDDFNGPAPTRQWVFLRPNLSPALVTGSEEEAGLDFGLTLELGHVWYRSKDYSSWWGLSGMVALTDDEGVGYGGMLRWNDYTLGVARHDKNDEDLIYVSVDLYRFVTGEKSRVNSAQGFLQEILDKGKDALASQ